MPFSKPTCFLDNLAYLEMSTKNVTTILSPFGTGHTRFLGIMMLEMLYVQCFNDWFQMPLNLGEYPDDIPINASAQQCSKLIICHKASNLVHDTFKAVTKCLQNQCQEAIHEDYLTELNDPDIDMQKSIF